MIYILKKQKIYDYFDGLEDLLVPTCIQLVFKHCKSKGLWTEFGSHVTNMACHLFSQVIPTFHLPLTTTLAPPICTPGLRKEVYKDYWPVERTDGKY